jgi:nitroreductase
MYGERKMDVTTAVRTRRTHKAFGSQPVDRATLLELFELARWAPNHRLTNPWRFRVLGVQTRAALAREAELAKPGSARKLDRAPTLVVASAKLQGDPGEQREDLLASAIAAYLVLLGAHARGLAGYWRTLPLLDTPAVRAALARAADEQPIGLLHLGNPLQAQRVPDRAAVDEIASFLR